MTIRLEQGRSLTGVVVQAGTGWVVPGALVKASPTRYTKDTYGRAVETRTDGQGRFHFSNLEPRAYVLRVNGALPKGATVEQLPDGRTRYHYPGHVDWPEVVGGQENPVTVPITLRPNSALQPIKPPE